MCAVIVGCCLSFYPPGSGTSFAPPKCLEKWNGTRVNVTFIDKYGFCTCLSSHLNLPSWKFCGGQFVFLTTLKIVSCTPSLRDFGKFSLQLISKLRQINDLLQVYTFHFLELFVKWRLLLFVFPLSEKSRKLFLLKTMILFAESRKSSTKNYLLSNQQTSWQRGILQGNEVVL